MSMCINNSHNYLPKQNLENISFITSSVTSSPVIFPRDSSISFIFDEIISIGILFSMVCFAFFKYKTKETKKKQKKHKKNA